MIDLRTELKKATRDLHDCAESSSVSVQVQSESPLSKATYCLYLKAQWSIFYPLEKAVAKQAGGQILSAGPLFSKSGCLEHDLRALGEFSHRLKAVPDFRLPKEATEAYLMGLLYVIEGSMLGAAVLNKRLQHEPALWGANQFLAGHEGQTKRRWDAFVERLNSLPENQWNCALTGALDCFEFVIEQFQNAPEHQLLSSENEFA